MIALAACIGVITILLAVALSLAITAGRADRQHTREIIRELDEATRRAQSHTTEGRP